MSAEGSMLLTHSQELDLLSDPSVSTMLGTFGNQFQAVSYLFDEQFEPIENVNRFNNSISSHEHNNEREQLSNENLLSNIMAQYSQPPDVIPIAPPLISNEEYPGPLNFEIVVDPQNSSNRKNRWVYSSMLNKLFISMSSPFPIDFKWNYSIKNLYVRATPLFSLAQNAQEMVTRCVQHTLPTDAFNRNISETIWDHVLRCQNPNAKYFGNKENKIHLNVTVPLGKPQNGTDLVRIIYLFVCKNSCPTGINRKPFEVVFTLEDDRGEILGRRKLGVRVCSCPKRDKEKDEKDSIKEGGTYEAPAPQKKTKLEKVDKKPPSFVNSTLDTKEYPVEMLICGKNNQKLVFKYAYDLMSGDIMRNGPDPDLKRCLDTLNDQIKNLE